MERISSALKFLNSFFVKEWRVNNYSLRMRHQDGSHPEYFVQIVKWWTAIGSGETEGEAIADLQRFLDRYREANGGLPRPGTTVPIQFATNERLQAHWDLLEKFICQVLSVPDGSSILVTDESALSDFDGAVPEGTIEGRFHEVFGVDVSHLGDQPLVDVFDYVRRKA